MGELGYKKEGKTNWYGISGPQEPRGKIRKYDRCIENYE